MALWFIIFIMLILLFLLCLYIIKSTSKKQIIASTTVTEKYDKPKNISYSENTEYIEVLDFDDYTVKDEKLKKEILDETIDLNELFKTMSINIVAQDKNFDFGLLRKRKKKF